MKSPTLSKVPELESGRTRIFCHLEASGLGAHRLSVYGMSGSPSVVFRPVAQEAAATTSRNLKKCQFPEPTPELQTQKFQGWEQPTGLTSPITLRTAGLHCSFTSLAGNGTSEVPFLPFSPCPLCVGHFVCYCHLRLTRTFQVWFPLPILQTGNPDLGGRCLPQSILP